jgi:hypothetical protein
MMASSTETTPKMVVRIGSPAEASCRQAMSNFSHLSAAPV